MRDWLFFRRPREPEWMTQMLAESESARKKVLNVGGGSKLIPIPNRFDGWIHHLLDIDARGKPDIMCDARELMKLDGSVYDAIYCSHNLEHYFAHDVPKVLRGFNHMLTADGFVEIRVPDLLAVMEAVVANKLDLVDPLYTSQAGPITVRDVIYGWGKEIEQSGLDFYAHKTGFSPKSMIGILGETGFAHVVLMRGRFELWAYGFKFEPSTARLAEIGLPAPKV